MRHRRSRTYDWPVAKTPIPSLRFEKEAFAAGAQWVAGVDEVGCGPIAGPVAAGVVLLPAGKRFRWYTHVRDSKVLPESARDELSARIRKDVPFAIGWASVEEIDRDRRRLSAPGLPASGRRLQNESYSHLITVHSTQSWL